MSFCINYLLASWLPSNVGIQYFGGTFSNGQAKRGKGRRRGVDREWVRDLFVEFCTHISNILVHFYGERKRQQLLSRIDGWVPRTRNASSHSLSLFHALALSLSSYHPVATSALTSCSSCRFKLFAKGALKLESSTLWNRSIAAQSFHWKTKKRKRKILVVFNLSGKTS